MYKVCVGITCILDLGVYSYSRYGFCILLVRCYSLMMTETRYQRRPSGFTLNLISRTRLGMPSNSLRHPFERGLDLVCLDARPIESAHCVDQRQLDSQSRYEL